MKLYQALAKEVAAGRNPAELTEKHLPHGSGFDAGCSVSMSGSSIGKDDEEDVIELVVEFHHMDENGFYCGWSHHRVEVRPSFLYGFTWDEWDSSWPEGEDIDQEGWLDYAQEILRDALETEV